MSKMWVLVGTCRRQLRVFSFPRLVRGNLVSHLSPQETAWPIDIDGPDHTLSSDLGGESNTLFPKIHGNVPESLDVSTMNTSMTESHLQSTHSLYPNLQMALGTPIF